MKPENLELADALDRLARLETQHRRIKNAAAVALLAGTALLAMAQTRPPGVVNATAFNLLGPDGSTVAVLGYPKGATQPSLEFGRPGPGFSMFSKGGMMIVGTDGILTIDGGEKPVIGFIRNGGHTSLQIEGGPDPSIMMASGNGAINFETPASGIPLLVLNDAGGFETDIGGASLITTTTGETHATSAASIVMFGKDNKVIWQAPK